MTFRERAAHPFRSSSYDQLSALRNITLQVPEGEFLGIVGPNGSGKSTLLRCVAGIYELDAGELEVRGHVSPFIELGAGFTNDLAAPDNIVLNAMMLGRSRGWALENLEDVLEFAELQEFRDLQLKNYSSGMRARLAFSIAIKTGGEILLVDEVLAVGDAAFQHKCFEEFERLKAEGKTTLLVTHEMSAIDRFCDRAMLIEAGGIAEIGEPERIAAAYEELAMAKERGDIPASLPAREPDTAPAAPPRRRRSTAGGDLPKLVSLTAAFAATEFKLHYMGSVLGYVWSVLRPLMIFGVIYLILAEVFPFGAGVKHYPIYLLTTIVLWTYFGEATGKSVTSLVDRRSLLQKARFPRLVVPLSAVLAAVLNLGMNLIAVFAFVFAAGITPRLSWLEFPLLLLFLIAFAAGIGLLLSALYARFRDVGQIWAVLLQILFYGSAILFVVTKYPDSIEQVMVLNPLVAVFTEMRHAVIDPAAPTFGEVAGGWGFVLVPVGIVAGVLALGAWVFNREAPRIVEKL